MNSFNKHILTLLLLLLAPAVQSHGQQMEQHVMPDGTMRTEYVAEFDLFFKVNDATFYVDYSTNRQSLDSLERFINRYGLNHIAKFEVVTYSSPEGGQERNEALARGRSEAALTYLVDRFPVLGKFDSNAVGGEAWEDLAKQIEADKTLTERQKEEAIDIIRSAAFTIPMKKQYLARLSYYRYMLNNLYPKVRHSALRLISYEEFIPIEEEEIVEERLPVEMVPRLDDIALRRKAVELDPYAIRIQTEREPVFDPVFEITKEKATILTLNTNLLYDLITALNFEVEVPIAGHFSLMAEDVFPWWETGNKYCFEMWEMGVEARYWFKGWDRVSTEKMRGFFVGPYVMSSKYDFQYDRKFNYQGEYWSVGASAGYAIGLGKKKKVSMNFSLALGFLQSDYRHYNPGNEYEFLIKDPYNIGKYTWMGPTKAKVTLCVPINTLVRRR